MLYHIYPTTPLNIKHITAYQCFHCAFINEIFKITVEVLCLWFKCCQNTVVKLIKDTIMTTNQLFPVYRLFVLWLDPWWTPLCWPFPLQPVGLRSFHRVTWLLHKWRLPLREFAHRTIMLRQMRRCSDMLNNKIDKAGFYKHIYSKNTRVHKYETKGMIEA